MQHPEICESTQTNSQVDDIILLSNNTIKNLNTHTNICKYIKEKDTFNALLSGVKL